MASGKAHAIATTVTGGVTAPLLVIAGQPISCASDTIMRHSVGRTLWWLWNLLWLPYAYLIPCHRHPLSHWPVLGTMLRVIYALSLPTLLWFLLGRAAVLPPVWPLPAAAWWAFGGLLLVDCLHALMDWLD